jgi:Zn ribbon nucleic-acid-binding protein
MKHNLCGKEFDMSPSIFLHGIRCPYCTKENTIKKLRKSHDEFIKEVYELVGDEYTILETYTKSDDKLKIRHNSDECNHYEYYVTPNGFLGGNRCPKCQGTYRRSHIEFIQDVEKVHEINAYKFLSEFVNLKTKIKVKHIECGNVWDIAPSTLLKKLNYEPCPFCSKSKGEIRVSKYLVECNIEFIPQMKFDGLLGIGGGNLSYDFYLPMQNLLIEYQGEFHDGTVHQQREEDFKRQQEHDRRKRKYANDNGIRLLEIWYWDFDNIEKILEKELI